MSEHHLRNARHVPNWGDDPTCHHCGDELWEADLYEMITPRPGMTFCNDDCYTQWVLVYGGPNPPKIDPKRVDAPDLYAAKAARDAEVEAHRQRVLADTLAWRAANHGRSDKSAARQSGEAAANVVGFLAYMIVISAIAAVIFAITGIHRLVNTTDDPDTLHRLLARFTLDSTGCWQWQGKPANGYGYGKFTINGRQEYVHRLTYQTFVAPILDGFEIDHLCRNTMCGNPAHLEAVDHRTNILRGVAPAAIHARKTHCVNGHPFDDANTYWTSRGTRQCRTCHHTNNHRSYHANKAAINAARRARYATRKAAQ